MFNWNSREKTKVKLEGCLDEDNPTQQFLCKHGNGGYCWFCHTGNEPEKDDEKDNDKFESKMFKSKL